MSLQKYLNDVLRNRFEESQHYQLELEDARRQQHLETKMRLNAVSALNDEKLERKREQIESANKLLELENYIQVLEQDKMLNESSLAEKSDQITKLEQLLNSAQSELKSETHDWNESRLIMLNESKTLRTNIKELTDQILGKAAELKQVQLELDNTHNQLRICNIKSEELATKLDKKTEEQKKPNQDLDKLKSELDQERVKANKLVMELSKAHMALDEYKNKYVLESEAFKIQHQQITNVLELRTSEVERCWAELDEHKQHLANESHTAIQLTAQFDQLKNNKQKMHKQLDESIQQLNKQLEENRVLNGKLTESLEQRQSLQADYNRLEAEAKNFAEALNVEKRNKDYIESQLNFAQHTIDVITYQTNKLTKNRSKYLLF